MGYAFINMVRPSSIPGLVAELHGKRWPKFNSEKVCCITYGRIQVCVGLVGGAGTVWGGYVDRQGGGLWCQPSGAGWGEGGQGGPRPR